MPEFSMSEPHCLIDYMNRHEGWCSVVCLIGGGQEINTGEAGLKEWVKTIKESFPNWTIHYPKQLDSNNYLTDQSLIDWIKITDAKAVIYTLGFQSVHFGLKFFQSSLRVF